MRSAVDEELPLSGTHEDEGYDERTKIREWMLKQVVEGSIDELHSNKDGYKESVVYRLIKGAESQASQWVHEDPKLTVCYTGPPALGFLIHSTTREIGVHVEFASDHQ